MTEQIRRPILENLPSLDEAAAKFAPKQSTSNSPSPEKVAEVAEKLNFTSRESHPTVEAKVRRKPMYHRTGRTAQFTCKTSPEIVDAFYDFASQRGWKVGETFERAFEALCEKEGNS